jgi:hypothetical protein
MVGEQLTINLKKNQDQPIKVWKWLTTRQEQWLT